MKARRTTHGGQQQSPSSQTSKSNANSAEQNQNTKKDGHVLGWFQSAGDWIADHDGAALRA